MMGRLMERFGVMRVRRFLEIYSAGTESFRDSFYVSDILRAWHQDKVNGVRKIGRGKLSIDSLVYVSGRLRVGFVVSGANHVRSYGGSDGK